MRRHALIEHSPSQEHAVVAMFLLEPRSHGRTRGEKFVEWIGSFRRPPADPPVLSTTTTLLTHMKRALSVNRQLAHTTNAVREIDHSAVAQCVLGISPTAHLTSSQTKMQQCIHSTRPSSQWSRCSHRRRTHRIQAVSEPSSRAVSTPMDQLYSVKKVTFFGKLVTGGESLRVTTACPLSQMP
jgi:hypothetical protein